MVVPVIVQEALETKFMMRKPMPMRDLSRASFDGCRSHVIAQFEQLITEDGRVDPPSIRNHDYLNEKAVFFDSFSPIHYTHAEMGKILLKAARKPVDPLDCTFIPQKLAGIQDEGSALKHDRTCWGVLAAPQIASVFEWDASCPPAMSNLSDDIQRTERPPRLPDIDWLSQTSRFAGRTQSLDFHICNYLISTGKFDQFFRAFHNFNRLKGLSQTHLPHQQIEKCY